ncbi:FAD-dependent oxidoreductase [Kribbella deserti]|uniref:FAD-dependent oxidoreductase n=1 Tax=Kribbella deserti TaxID=1926257 RepID=A0ABV6QR87_9ACTN
MSERTAVVVGAGIGGVTAAAALSRRGWRVTLLERAPELGEVGAGISVWPKALQVLDGLGAKQRLGDAGIDAVQGGLRRPDGRWLIRVSGTAMEAPMMVHRARLHEAITATFPASVQIRTGVTVVGVEQDATSATVIGSAGEEFTADLVVAADGLRSVVRTALNPGHPGPRYSGYTAFRGVAEVDRPDDGGETWGRGYRFGYLPLVDGRVYWYATATAPAQAKPAQAKPAQAKPVQPELDVTELFQHWHDPIPALVGKTPPETVLRNDVYDLALPLPPFVTGRVVLLGDAAHAMTPNLGQGACAAIQDAGVLAEQLERYGEQPAALESYDRIRRTATTKLVRRSRRLGVLGQVANPVAATTRDGVLALIGQAARLLPNRRPTTQPVRPA